MLRKSFPMPPARGAGRLHMLVSLALASIWIVLALIWLAGNSTPIAVALLAASAILVVWLLLRPAGVARVQRAFLRR